MHLRTLLATASLAALAGCAQEPTTATFTARALHSDGTPFFVIISGPTSVKPNQTCTYTALRDGGVGPYEYDWLGVTGSTNTQVTTARWTSIGNKVISVTANDADAQTSTAGLGVLVTSNAPDCT